MDYLLMVVCALLVTHDAEAPEVDDDEEGYVTLGCQEGETKACGVQISPTHPLSMTCRPDSKGRLGFHSADCATPLVVAFDDAPVQFTEAAGTFAIGPFARTEWVDAKTPWLGIDLDGSGCIESEAELFGTAHGAQNGFLELARYDENGDGRIDEHDAAYWADRDQDRRCIPSEIVPIAKAGIVSLDLSFAPSPKTSAGSYEGERGSLLFRATDGTRHEGRLIDVYLAPMKSG